MKRLSTLQSFILLLFILLTALVSNVWCQKYATVLGNDDGFDPVMIIRFEVVDSETHMPINGARITLTDEPNGPLMFSLETDKAGIGVIVVMKWGAFRGGNLKIIAPEYHFWETDLEQWDFYEKRNDFRLYIPGQEGDWSSTSRPTVRETIAALKTGNYRILSEDDGYFQAPSCFEYMIELNTVNGRDNE